MSRQLFIAGASVRAAAQSAARVGFAVTAADLFCDRDLTACSRAYPVRDYPNGILPIARQLPPMEWLYTGGLENEPALVDAVSGHHALLGHPGSVLRQVRDPWQVSAALVRAGLRFPPPERHRPTNRTGRWLSKPVRSCGGAHVRWCTSTGPHPELDRLPGERPAAEARERPGTDLYFQPWIGGPSYGAVFVASRGRAVLLGVTRQLLGCPWAGAGEFRYVGSIGPIAWDRSWQRQFERIGSCLAAAFPLDGLFGVDTVVAGPDLWAIEVNPRYTASVEILERAAGWTALEFHREACRGGGLPEGLPPCVAGPLHGKAIVYATADCTVEPEFYRHLDDLASAAGGRAWADLPAIGTRFRAGQPVLTVFARGQDVRTVHRGLRRLASRIRAWLTPAGAPATR